MTTLKSQRQRQRKPAAAIYGKIAASLFPYAVFGAIAAITVHLSFGILDRAAIAQANEAQQTILLQQILEAQNAN